MHMVSPGFKIPPEVLKSAFYQFLNVFTTHFSNNNKVEVQNNILHILYEASHAGEKAIFHL